jgi:hypothetical protein
MYAVELKMVKTTWDLITDISYQKYKKIKVDKI